MNRCVPRANLAAIVALTLLLASVWPAKAGVSTGPQPTNSAAAEERRRLQFFDAEYSFQQKLRVGRERYEQKQANRAKVIEGMAAQLQARQRVVVTQPRSYSEENIEGLGDWPHTVLPFAALLLGLVGVRYRLNRGSTAEMSGSKDPPRLAPYLGPAPVVEPEAVLPAKSEAILTCNCCGANAQGRCVEEGFMVLKGSIGAERGASSPLSKASEAVCATLIESGVLRKQGSRIIFEQDHVFSTPSQAAAAVLGMSANGWLIWKTEDGITLEKLERLGR